MTEIPIKKKDIEDDTLFTRANGTHIGEVIHLLETMHRYGVKCGVQFVSGGEGDLEIRTDGCVKAGYDGTTLMVVVGESEFTCTHAEHECYAKVTEHNILVGLINRDYDYDVVFDSGKVLDEVVEMAKLYDNAQDKVGDIKLKITSSDPYPATDYLNKLLSGGRVIKEAKVLFAGQQVLTVGDVSNDEKSHESGYKGSNQRV